jgi:hypothetical protein
METRSGDVEEWKQLKRDAEVHEAVGAAEFKLKP